MEQENEPRFFIIDYGHDLEDIAIEIIKKFKNTEDYHIVTYLTDIPNSFMITETVQEDFLAHYQKPLNNKK